MSSPLWAVLPGSIDDPAAPSGGNRYDRVVLNLLSGAATPQDGQTVPTRPVYEVAVDGSWPRPADEDRESLARALSDIPDGADVLLDGLVACGVPEVLAPHKKRLRLIVLVHLPLSDETGLSPAEAADLRARERTALHMAATVIATSDAAAQHLSDLHELSRPDVKVVEPGVSPAEPAVPDESGARLLCVAAVTPRKGQDLLVTALEKGLSDLAWTCVLAGRVLRPVPHTSRNIRFVGPLHGTALDNAYGKCDVLVFPSRNETYGMVVTEALARGVPVIATAVGGVPEALGVAPDGTRPGLLVPPDDARALAAALRAWLTDADLRVRLRAAALARRATLPTWDDTARRLSEVLDN
ncbi:glycosyltransferase family 4 protein [Actinoplanes sp. KI2]|uniref:glycosyltransferase family 4 protein n=1 Tax=Actinoplanes sp. KI2 TaxID=2983315 RepID=UPI0021D58BD0|nr:glycosyltransferase family 4 protein [Actinoplanes sp. KI2]MCU7722721.1 glycosyltransferase family 4 protein [Actinoplanes sp. KI2]